MLSNLTVLLVLCFYKLNTRNPWKWEDVGYRTGFMSVAQLPLIVFLSGRDNIIGFLSGVGYEQLNWLHRWTARTLWLTTTIHMGFWFRNWARYDYILIKLTGDPITQRGFASWCILTFVILSSAAPVRKLSYEIFVISHLVTFAGFIAAVWLHVPEENKVWVWLPIASFALDRVLRAAWYFHLNFAPSQLFRGKPAFWTNRAFFTSLPEGLTKITIPEPGFSWKPGQHLFLSCHSLIPFQSHPFTIASIPSDGKLEFLVKAHKGGTKTFYLHANKSDDLPLTKTIAPSKRVGLEGPYGRIRALGQFDSVVLFAGSNGATFTVPHLRHLVECWKTGSKVVTRTIRFVWVIKSRDQLCWFDSQLRQAHEEVERNQARPLEVRISIYVTCDEDLVNEKNTPHCCQPAPAPGRTDSTSSKSKNADEKSLTTTLIQPSRSSDDYRTQNCCCRNPVSEDASGRICTCATEIQAASLPPSTSASTSSDTQTTLAASHESLAILSGRPRPRNIIRRVLEEAEGESAVVVCGPRGLQEDVRASVVALSDERAVHKGTGAMGIYFHAEGFCY